MRAIHVPAKGAVCVEAVSRRPNCLAESDLESVVEELWAALKRAVNAGRYEDAETMNRAIAWVEWQDELHG